MTTELLQGFYLNDVLVEPAHGRVTLGSGALHLAPKAMEVLLCLAKRAGEVVERQELLESVWGQGHGSAEALNHAIGEIRRALDDHHDHPTYIQTLPRRGYRLLVTPQPADVGTGSVVIGTDSGARLEDIGLFENLRQRGVFETALAYLILGWLLIQVADIVFAQLLLPRWAGTFVTVLVIAGFPIALVLSWFIEIRGGNAVLDQLSPRDRRRRRFSNTYLSVLGGLSIAAVAVFIYDRSIGLPQESVTGPAAAAEELLPVAANSIAVLPLMALDDTEESRILSRGIAEDVISMLSTVPGLLVASRGDSFSLQPNSESKQVRGRLRVAMYVEGSIQYDNELLRVVVQLIDSDTGFHRLSRKFDRPLENYFDVRDEITALVVSNLRPALPPTTRENPVMASSDPAFDVYFMYRKGMEASRDGDSESRIDEALGWFENALDVDAGYAPAHAGKCNVHVQAYIWSKDPVQIERAEASCSKALTLNPNLDVVYTSLGELYAATGQFDKAESAYQSALDIDSNSSIALMGLGAIYRQTNRPDKAEASLRQATGLHPGDWAPYNALGSYLFRSGRYAEAAEQYRKVVSLDATNSRGYRNLGTALSLVGRLEDAETAFRRALDLEPNSRAYDQLGLLLYSRGKFAEAAEMFGQAIGLRPGHHLLHSHLADAMAADGRHEAAVEAYAEARSLAEAALDVNPNDAFTQMDLAWISAALGDFERATGLIDAALVAVPDDPFTHYTSALIDNRLGATDRAFDALERAVELGYSTALLESDPNLEDLKDDRRWAQLTSGSK